MRLIFEDINTNEYVNNIEIESIIYNRSNLDEELLNIAAENFANSLISDIEENSKFIKSSFNIDDFSVEYDSFLKPTLILKFKTPLLLSDDELKSILGRYVSKEYSEEFELDDTKSEIVFKPIRSELKIYLAEK